MKKNKKDIKVPAHMFGLFSAISQAAGMAGQALQQSGANDVGQALAGAANPLQAGMQYLGNSDVSTGNKLLAFTGIGSVFAAKQAREAARRREERKTTAQNAMAAQSAMTEQFWADNQQANAFAYGGIPLANLAYVDSGELMRDVEGNIQEVPSKPGTDSHLMDVGNVESILSDQLTIPGTKETYADRGRSILAGFKPSKNVGATADITDMLNDTYVQNQYNNLLRQQEEHKMKQGIKPKSKSIPGYAIGGDLLPIPEEIPGIPVTGRKPDLSPITLLKAPPLSFAVPANRPNLPEIGDMMKSHANQNIETARERANRSSSFNFENVANYLGTTAPIFSNVLNGMRTPEQTAPQGNVNAGAIQNAMARRSMNIDPMLETMQQDRAISRSNMANLNPNTGMNQAFGIQSAVDRYRNTANVYSAQSNANNAYLGEYASIMDSLGRQYEDNRRYTEDINAQNRAMQRNYFNTAATQMGQYAQTQQLMKNQRGRDAMIMPLLSQYLAQGYSGDTVNALQRQFYGRAV